jgi:hypothetical protein
VFLPWTGRRIELLRLVGGEQIVTARVSARITSGNDDDLGAVQGERMTVEQHTVSAQLQLPEIRAWALRSFPASAGEIDSIIREWSRAARTRSELYWLEGALAWQRRRAAGRR